MLWNDQCQAEEGNAELPDPRRKMNVGSVERLVTGRTIARLVDVAALADAADHVEDALTPEKEVDSEAEEEVAAEASMMADPKS